MQDRIRKHLKQEFGEAPEFWFVVERDNKERFHLHGAVVCGLDNEDVYRRADQALKRAGGTWTKAKAGRLFQQHSRSLDDPYVCAGYVVKDINLTSMDIEHKLLASTAEIRASARGGWDALRSSLPKV